MSRGSTGGDRVEGGGSGGCDGMVGSGDSEGGKTKAGGTALKDLINNTQDPRWKSRGSEGRTRRRRRARREETRRNNVEGGAESLKKEDTEPNTLNGDGKILKVVVVLIRKKLHHDTGGPSGRDSPLRITMGVALPLLKPGRDHRVKGGSVTTRAEAWACFYSGAP